MPGLSRTAIGLTVAMIMLLFVRQWLPGWAANTLCLSLATGMVILGMLLMMRLGLVSFGHGLFFALGGYAAALANVFLGITDAFVMLFLGGLTAAVIAFGLGFLMSRYRAIFFAMLSMAFSMILFGLLVNSATLGSTDGFSVSVPTFAGAVSSGEGSRLGWELYGLIVIVSWLSALAAHRFLSSTWGFIAEAIRENEIRVEYLGTSVRFHIHVVYVLAALLAGIGGAMTVLLVGHVTPEDTAYWTKSGEFVFIAILSGTGNVAAPFLGAIVFELIRTYALQYAPDIWQMLLGTVLLLVIMFLPGGLWSVVSLVRGKRKHG